MQLKMNKIRLKMVGFYQAVTIEAKRENGKTSKSNFTSVHGLMRQTGFNNMIYEYIPAMGTIKISGENLIDDIYIGMANVRFFHTNEEIDYMYEEELVSAEESSDKKAESNDISKKKTSELSEEDQKIFLFDAITRITGKKPNHNTGLPKLKQMYEAAMAEDKK